MGNHAAGLAAGKTKPFRQIDDPWNPCFGGRISNVGACWVRISDQHCFSVKAHADGAYTLTNGQTEITVPTNELPELFRPT